MDLLLVICPIAVIQKMGARNKSLKETLVADTKLSVAYIIQHLGLLWLPQPVVNHNVSNIQFGLILYLSTKSGCVQVQTAVAANPPSSISSCGPILHLSQEQRNAGESKIYLRCAG